MATLQDIIAKRKKLGANATNVDARKALETVAPTPTAPVAATPTPVTPTPVTPQPIVNAPVDPNTGLSKPLEQTQTVAPTPATVAPEIKYANNPDGTPVTAEVKPPEPVKTTVASTVTPKIEAPIDYTQAKGRESEITANLDSFKAKGMTPDEIIRASDYQNASPEKKALIEPYLKTQVPTASAMYNAIVAKADIPEEQKLTPSYKIAQNRYTKANMFSGMTPSQLANEIKNVKLVEGSQTYEDLKAMNPKLVQDATNLRKVNGGKSNIFTYTNNADGTTTKVNNLEQTFADDFNDNFGEFIKSLYKVQTPEEIRAIIYTPDVQQAEEKAKSIELDMNKIDDALDQVDTDIEKELSGSGATGSRIALAKASRKDALNKQRDSLERNYTTYANKANNLITQNTSVYQTQQTQKNAQNAAMLPFITDQYKTQQEKIKAEQALNDPQTQIQATMDEFAKMGITAQGNTASKIAEFKASGLSLPDYITRLRGQFMSKPEYKAIQAQEAGKGISYETIGDSVYRKNADGSLTKTGISASKGDATPTIQRIGGTTESPVYGYFKDGKLTPVSSYVSSANAPTTTSAKMLDVATGTDVGVQCGTFARQLCGLDATPGGNSLEARQKAFVDTTPQAGGMVLFTGGGYDKTYGHIASIESVNQDGTLNIVESNLKGDNKVTRRTIQSNDPAISGFYNNTPLAKQSTGGQKEYSDSDIALLGSVEKLDKQGKATLSDNGYTEKEWANFKAGLLPPTSNQKTQASSVVSQIDDMLTGDALSDAVGTAKTPGFISGTERKDFEAKFASFRDNLALSNIDKLKGAMSDKDIEFLRNTASSLNLDMSEAEFIKQLNAIKTKYTNIAGGVPVNKQSNTAPAYKVGDEDAVIASLKAKKLL